MSQPRRTFLRHLCGCSAALWLPACQTTDTVPLSAGHKPAIDTDEAGLWRLMRKAEEDLKTSKFRIHDPEINTYLNDLACNIAGDLCPDIRVYLTRTPFFNASMAPNGMMQIWTGLLTRVENEAQLAAVIGHEIGHYVERHSLERLRYISNAAAVAQILGMGIAVAGGGALAQLPGIFALGSIFAYSRDQEREADSIGLDLMHRAGFAPVEAAQVWENLIAERAEIPEEQKREPDLFTATHPQPAERQKKLRDTAKALSTPAHIKGQARLLTRLRPMLDDLLADEVNLRQPERSLYLLKRWRKNCPDDAVVAFYFGEIYRLRNQDEDLSQAITLYRQALAMDDPLPQTWRSLGLALRQTGRQDEARQALEAYLEAEPNAPDAAFIQRYLQPLS